MGTQSDRTGILIVRLWIEGDARQGFRARVMHTLDSTGSERAMSTSADPEDVCAVVRTWVEAFVDQGSRVGSASKPGTL
jgi:hypothetical protein